MGEDLTAINEAVVPVHPIVTNAHTMLTQVPGGADWFTVLDLREAFFGIPLSEETQPLFAREACLRAVAALPSW